MDRIHRLAENTQGLQVGILRPIGPLYKTLRGFLYFIALVVAQVGFLKF